MGGAPLAELDDLQVQFGAGADAVQAVRGVSLHVMPGEVLCLLGESGSGKSVSMRALMRLLPPQARISGGVRVEGRGVATLPGPARRCAPCAVALAPPPAPGRWRCWTWCACRTRGRCGT